MKKGWEIKKLGEVCEIQLGKTPHRKTERFWDKNKETSNVWISIADMKHGKTLSVSKEHISDLGAEKIKIIPKGTLMLSFKLTLGRVSFAGIDLYSNEAIASIINLSSDVSSKYLYYYFTFFDWNKATEGDIKVKGKTLNKEKLKNLDLIIPPLNEQKQIVTILDKAFTVIDQAKTNAQQNLLNAKELFESYLQNVFENNVSGTQYDALNDICELIVDCEHKTAPKQETGYPSIRTPNIGQGVLILEGVNRVSEETYIKWTRRAIPKEDDLILAREAPAGNIGVIPKNVKVCLGQRTVLIRPKMDKFISKYLAFLILSKKVQKLLLSHSTGATVQHINMKDIRAFKIYNLPTLKEQVKIINGIDEISAETKKLEVIYQQKIDDLEALKKSVLNKAFSGELTQKELV